MNRTECAGWLRNYVENGCGDAFAKLVTGYFDLVYSAALRVVAGDAHLAQDVAQTVFADLARKANYLPREVYLGGWLYRHTCFTAAKAVRTERRRQNRERQAVEMNPQNDPADAAWQQLAPVLEEAMRHLGDADRDAIVLRYFERQPFRAVGETLGTSEDAARKRVDRALEQLRDYFGRRGVTVSATVLAGVLNTQAVTTAPVGLAALVAGSLAGTATATGTSSALIKLITMTTQLKIAGAIVVAGMAVAIAYQSQLNAKLRAENHALSQQAAQLDQLRADNERLARAPVPKPLAEDQLRDLLRLRGEVGNLKRQLSDAVKERDNQARLAQQAPQSDPPADPEEQQKQLSYDKMNFTRNLILAMHIYRGEYDGHYPTNVEQLAPYYDKSKDTNDLTDLFEIVYQGPIQGGTNLLPSETIVFREKQPWQTTDGGWLKTYGFLDGHSEIHKAPPDGNFVPWENERLQQPAVSQ